MLPHLTYKINRFGAVSRMPLIQCYPQDIARLELIARMYENLMIGRSCADADAKTLLDGHAEYVDFKDGGKVVVIK